MTDDSNPGAARSPEDFRRALLETVQRLTLVAEYKDDDARMHGTRISHYTELVVRELGIPMHEAGIMSFAAPMHDIGKVGVPDSILLKQGTLTPQEFEIMKTHTTIGARIVHGSENPYLVSAGKFALYHHERWDGTGYPQELRGEEIPIEGRIMYLIDLYDALRSRRPYKPPFRHDVAASIMIQGDYRSRPGHFDPTILEIFRANEGSFRKIFDDNEG
jgi:putative two-component system response regulator